MQAPRRIDGIYMSVGSRDTAMMLLMW